jgi:type IV pilus assembly protein PilW
MKSFSTKKEIGFSLIELMIAVALGIVVVGATLGIFAANRITYVASENVGRIQENARAAFEIMGRELREAGGNPCSNSPIAALQIGTANVLNSSGTNWWSNWDNRVFGYESGALAGSVAGTDALEIKSAVGTSYSVQSHATATATITLNNATPAIAPGDLLLMCDFDLAVIFQMSNGAGATVVHGAGAGTPGNCTQNLGRSPGGLCTNTVKQYPANSILSKLSAAQWYVGLNGRPNGSRSLYRRTVRGGVAVVEEVAEGVRDMQVLYLLSGAVPTYETAATVTTAARWLDVTAVRVDFVMEGTEIIGTDGQKLQRRMTNVVALRNRNQ